ncbi:MAG TPA: carboxypeptidase regulatory-like domain-containing protein, partial [Vicinamibacterales bacterium]|nr:carboxypeptidase regulatory-like domain-containing protein [Vicinamibacterales bacterium]
MESRLRLVPASFLVVVTMAVMAAPASAQATSGTLSGTVKDGTGAVLPGVTIVITNTDTQLTRTIVTDPRGHYAAPDLPPGPYSVKGTLQGFNSALRTGITLTVGAEAVLDLELNLGKLSDEVIVVAEAKTVDTQTASTGGLISTAQIEGLPLNGRSFVELANLTPGVQLTQTGGQSTSTGLGAKLSVNGSRYTSNLFTLDGTNLNDQFSQAGSASGNVLGVEAVREFQVLTNSFSAEYGHHTGGIINAATKSGTNSLHGSVFEFHRDDAIDAKNYFDQEKPPFARNQFGYSVGGPIITSRTFFFTTYEALRERLGQTNLFTVPSASVRQGAVAGNIRPYLDSYPLPNGDALGTTRGEYRRVDERTTNENYIMGRIDHQIATGSQLFVRYTLDDAQVDDPSRLNTGSRLKTRVQFATAEHTLVRGSSFLNRVQFGFTRSRLDGTDYLLDGFTMPRTTFTDIDRGLAAVTVTGLSAYGGDTTNPKFHRFNNFQIRENVTWNHGAQNVKIGGDVQIMQFNLTSDFTSMGQYTFSSLDNFLIGRVNQFNAVVPGSDATRNLRQSAFGFYVQDDIRARKNLTLNLGVRYEPTTSVRDTKDRLAQLIDFGSATATLNDTTTLTTLFRNPSLKTVAPRAGFAWDVRGDGKTSVRGGIGIFYDSILVSTPFVQNTAVRVPPYFNRGGLQGSSTFVVNFPDAYTTQAAQLAAQAQLEGIQYDLDQPMMTKWNVNVQRELFAKTMIEVGYSGSHGANLVRQIFTNGRFAQETPDGRLFVAPGTPLAQPNFGRMRFRVSDGTSDYDGMTIGLTRRMSRGLQAQVSYTLSKSVDDGASALGGNDFTNESVGGRYLYEKDRGLSPFDVRNALVASVNYALPFGASATGVHGALVKGWTVGTLIRYRSGYPFSAFSGVDTGLQVQGWAPEFPDLRPGASVNPVLGTVDHWFDPTAFVLPAAGFIGTLPRNTIIGPDLRTVDLIAGKSVLMGGSRELQLRFECFNLLNRANFGTPQQNV